MQLQAAAWNERVKVFALGKKKLVGICVEGKVSEVRG